MSPNEIKLKRKGEGTYEVPFDYGVMEGIIVDIGGRTISATLGCWRPPC